VDGQGFAEDFQERSKARLERGISWPGAVGLLQGGFHGVHPEQVDQESSGRSLVLVDSNAVASRD